MAFCPAEEKVYGYEDSRFEKDVDEHFHCSICYNVLKDPRMCRNNEHIFCLACISEQLRVNSQTCPECNEYLSVDTLRRARLASNCLSKLKINCDHASRGCAELTCLENLETHVANCGYAPVLCSNAECGMVINKRERVHHETEICEYRKVKCHDCGQIQEDVGTLKGSLMELDGKVEAANKEMKKSVGELRGSLKKLGGKVEAADKEMKKNHVEMKKVVGELKGSLKELDGKVEAANKEMKKNHVEVKKVVGKLEGRLKELLFVVGGMLSNTIETLDLDELPLKCMKYYAVLPYYGLNHQTVVSQQRVIYIGGDQERRSDMISEFQLTSPVITMKTLCQMPDPRSRHGAETFEDKVMILGGEGRSEHSLNSVLEFDVKKNECKEMPPLPHPLTKMATVRWRDQVVVLGGHDKDRQALNDVFMYDCKTGKTTALPPMFEKRFRCCAVITGNTIVVMGGANEKGEDLSSVECFTMGGSTWEYLPAMNKVRYGAVAEVLPSTRKYVLV